MVLHQQRKEGLIKVEVRWEWEKMCVVSWKDSNVVHLVSTMVGVDPVSQVSRWDGMFWRSRGSKGLAKLSSKLTTNEWEEVISMPVALSSGHPDQEMASRNIQPYLWSDCGVLVYTTKTRRKANDNLPLMAVWCHAISDRRSTRFIGTKIDR